MSTPRPPPPAPKSNPAAPPAAVIGQRDDHVKCMCRREQTTTLAEALAKVELEAGKTYACIFNGKRVTLRVAGPEENLPAARDDESDVMLDPWIELPLQGTPLS